MKVKGFTLIELLAVIVILAIIALIAVPIILNIIGSSKKSAVVRSGELYLKAVETAIARENLNNQFNPTTCVIGNDGNLTCDEDKTLTIEVNGSKPTSGTITLEKGKIKEVTDMTLTGFELEKKPGEKLKIKGTSSPEESIKLSEPTYSIDTTERAPQKTVTITYPEIEGKNLVYEYSIDNGTSWQTATQSQQVKFTAPGSVIARVSYKTNTITAKSFPVANIGEILNPQGTYLNWCMDENSEETTFWDGPINRSQVEAITIEDTKTVPNNAIGSWDVSAKKDGSVIAWYTDTNNNNLYELYIGGEGGVKANPNSRSLFKLFTNVVSLDISNLDTSNVTTMSKMFYGLLKLNSLDISNLDTSKVTTMSEMFYGCKSLTNLNVSNLDTSKVTTMENMFASCSNLTSLDISNFNTGKVTNMNDLFCNCSNLKTINLSNIDTSNVTTMVRMFFSNNPNNLINIMGLNTLDISNVTDISLMFSGCSSLTTLDLSNFDTSKVTNMWGVFQGCSNLTMLDLSNFDTGNVTQTSRMFMDCSSLTNLNLNGWNTQQLKYAEYMFDDCSNLTTLDLSSFSTSNLTKMGAMFQGCSSLTTLDLSNFVISSGASIFQLFNNCSNLENIDLRNAEFINISESEVMFRGANKITTIMVKNESSQNFINARLGEENITGVTVTIA